MLSEIDNLLASSYYLIKRMGQGGFLTICLLSALHALLSFNFHLPSSILNLQSSNLYAYPPGWSDDIMISNDTVKHQVSSDIDVDSHNNVWACWLHVASAFACEIYYTKRDSLGNCLIPATNISNNPTNSGLPEIVVDNHDNVHIVWCDQEPQGMWHAKLANDGTVLVPAHPAALGAGPVTDPEIVLNKYQEINIAWDENPSGRDLTDYTKLDTLGNTIIEKIRVSPGGVHAIWPGIGVDSFANNHITYRKDTTGMPYQFTYTKLDRDGNFLISNRVLGWGGDGSIVSDQNQKVHIVYCDLTGPGNTIKYLKLDQNGNVLIGPMTISPPQILSNTYSHLAIDSLQFLHVVWEGDSMAVFHIMYCKMDTSGNFAIPPMKIVCSPYTMDAERPRIAVDRSNRLHVVWTDGRLGNADIFYKRGENEPVGIEKQKLKQVSSPYIFVFPNPFLEMTSIKFQISNPKSQITLKIYDVTGCLVRQWDHQTIRQSDQILWHGDDDAGHKLPAGVYFLQCKIGDNSALKKIIKLK